MSLITTKEMFEKICREKELVLLGMYENLQQSRLVSGDELIVGVNYSTDRKLFRVVDTEVGTNSDYIRYKRISLEEVK